MTLHSVETIHVPVSAKGSWNIVRVRTDDGSTGLGEATHALGFTKASAEDDRRIERTVADLFDRFLKGMSVGGFEAFRLAALQDVRDGGLLVATAFSALEQALWDLHGKALGVPVYQLLGGALKSAVPAYANINRATFDRSPEGFARNARQAVSEGFRALKAAVFDDYPETPAEVGIERLRAMRRAVGGDVRIMVDCHSRFDESTAVEVAQTLAPVDLHWYEEPVDFHDFAATRRIKDAVPQRIAAGELLFGREGFLPLLQSGAVDVIMPDVKHCGGLLEGKKISAIAEAFGIQVSPHNPSGPVSMGASAHLAATLPNCPLLEHAWGEVDWRAGLLDPPELFRDGAFVLSARPGFGFELNESELARRL